MEKLLAAEVIWSSACNETTRFFGTADVRFGAAVGLRSRAAMIAICPTERRMRRSVVASGKANLGTVNATPKNEILNF